MGKSKLTACLVTYNHSYEEIAAVISCFDRFSDTCKVYISDNSNNSIAKDLDRISENYQFVEIISGDNVGFGAGHNRVLDLIDSEFHLIVNPDIHFHPEALTALLDSMKQNPDVGVCSPRAVYPDGKPQVMARLLPSPFDLLLRKVKWLSHLFRRRFEQHTYPSNMRNIGECYFLHGFFLVFRTSVFKRVNGYDENFFMYMEDVDILRRVSSFSKVVYVPHVFVEHAFKRGSSKSIKLLGYHIKSSVYYFNKWGWFFDKERKLLNRRVLSQV